MFYIGQDVVCIKTHSMGIVKEGDVYNIKELRKGCCDVQIHVGLLTDTKYTRCFCGKLELGNGIIWFSESLFKPLDELSDISELLEVLNK